MSLKQDISKELMPIAELLDKTAGRFGYNEIYGDWIDYMVACFEWDGDIVLANHLKSKYGKDYQIFNDLLVEYMNICKHQIERKEWYDGLGIIYETISSRWKSSAMGQFFTPPPIVDLMVAFNGREEIGTGKTVSDPTCGSGRLLIAHHAKYPGNYHYGQDLDPICAKMSAINMMIHGCVGEVSCMNTLTMEWRFGYFINPYLGRIKTPQIVKIKNYEDSHFYVGGSIYEVGKKAINKIEKFEENVKAAKILRQEKVKVDAQLSLF
jgi:type I restriction enzyme M protein